MYAIERKEKIMKRSIVLLTAFAVVMTMAVSAVAKPPPGKGKPPKPGDAPVAVTIEKADESTWTLHEEGDVNIYDVAVTTAADVSGVVGVGGDVTFIDEDPVFEIPGTTVLKAMYTVTAADMTNLVVSHGIAVDYIASGESGQAATTYTEEINPYPTCDFADPDGDGIWTRTWVQGEDMHDICIWKPPADGHWTLTVDPGFAKRTNFIITLRDDVPGNWCTVPEGAPDADYYATGVLGAFEDPSGVLSVRWKPNDGPVSLNVYLPAGNVPGEAQGICLDGGAGGETMGVGNTASYYLVAPGTVTAQPRPFDL
jgi:hypothetical protein